MPVYEFRCNKCKKDLSMTLTLREREQGVKCPKCGGPLEPLMSGFMAQTAKKS
jgi:putative FmdB family regulatory protein